MFKKIGKCVVLFVLFVAIFALAGCGQSSAADPYAQFKGRNMNFIVPYTAGGGFDQYARLLAPAIEKFIPGLTVVVRNEPGAGSIVGTNQTYLARADGLTVGIINVPGMTFTQMMGSEGVRFDLANFTYICRVSSESHVLALGAQSPFNSVEDLRNAGRPIKIAFTGVGSDDYYAAIILFKAMGVEIDLIAGYNGQNEATLAVVRGEVDGTMSTFSSLSTALGNKDVKAIMQLADVKIAGLEDVPFAEDLVSGADAVASIRSIKNIFALDRCIVSSPNLPEDVKTVLRDAFKQALNDPEFLERAATAKRPISPLYGAEIDPLLEEAMQNAEGIKDVLTAAMKK